MIALLVTAGAICASAFVHYQVTPPAFVQNLVIRLRHLHWFHSWPSDLQMFQIWSPGCVTCIVTLPWIVQLALSAGIELVSSSARVTSVKFHQDHRVSNTWTRGIPGSDKSLNGH